MSTMAYPPFLLARLASTIDHIAGGRFGWNIVTSGEDSAAQNFGLDELPPREQRYAMADEYVELVCRLFDSWGPDAVVMDRATGTFADHTKVNPVNFEGKFFKCRGPLNTVRSPQGRPAFVQAGGSPRGREFAARTADSIIATANGHAGMKAYRDDVRARATAAGRNPDDIKVLFLIYPCIGETNEEAWAKYRRLVNGPAFIEAALAAIGTVTDIDFSQFDLDQPLPHLTTNGEQGSLDKFAQWGSGENPPAARVGALRWRPATGRHAGRGRGEDGRRDGGHWRRRLPGQHPVPTVEPPGCGGDHGGAGAGAAAARIGADGVSGIHVAGCVKGVLAKPK